MGRGWLAALLVFGLLTFAPSARAEGHGGGAKHTPEEMEKEFEEAVEKGDFEKADELLWDLLRHQMKGRYKDFDTTDRAKLREETLKAAKDKHYADAGYFLERLQDTKEKPLFGKALDLAIWTLVVFLVLAFVLGRFAWRPMLQGLEQREHTIHSELEQAQKERQEAQALNERWKAEMAQAQEQVRQMLDEARRNGQHAAEELLNKAKIDGQAERERGWREIVLATDQALQQIAAQTANLAALVSSKAIRRQLTPEDHRQLVDEALAELNQGRRKNGQG